MTRAAAVVPVHHYLAAAAKRRPDAVAVIGERRLTYAELDASSNAFARALWRHHAERGDRIALWLPKSSASVIAAYGALKAGCAYVPLDPEQPGTRAAAILGDAEPTVLVTDAAHLGQLSARGLPDSLVVIVLVDAEGPALAKIPVVPLEAFTRGPAEPLADAAEPDDLAILLYTSGSTGVPKGVRITFRNLHPFVSWAIREMDLREHDVFANHAGLHFDLSTFDLFAAAAVGAAVWLVTESEARAPDALASGLARHGVTIWYSVPSILCLLLAAGGLDEAPARALRYVLFAGEVFPIKQLRELRARLPEAALYNLYGPTETNVCTYHRVDARAMARESPVPIGRPLDALEAWIVDERGEPCGDGEIGELIIRGPCVTPGYWRRTGYAAEADHQREVHPTGDLVSIEAGEYVYRGRKDRMVKLNGFRVELGEIEAALLQHEGIAEAAVITARAADVTRLVAFYAPPSAHAGLSLLQMKAHCRDRLPRYMIPHALTRLERLPRNANGKVDLVRLAELAAAPRPVSE
ncbi:MAG: amino acid adenylation domain-containing protein [Kofleriaceae bacterium]